MSVCSAALVFEKAKAAFDAGDFATAAACASAAENRILTQVSVSTSAADVSPLHSIVIVTQGHSTDLDNLLAQVATYLGKDFELVLVTNTSDSLPIHQAYENMTIARVGFNYGCSGGRNIGARLSRGRYVIFFDDDGVLKQGSLKGLTDAIQHYNAIAVRGRVIPKSDHGLMLHHYDYGGEVLHSTPNTEGISIWRREEFLHFGGFDPLLAGHEGIALYSKMFRFHGPDSFLYVPAAVLCHDYAKDESHLEEKKRKLAFNLAYLDYAYPKASALWAAVRRRRKDARTRTFFAGLHHAMDQYTPESPLDQTGVTVLTVAKNVRPLLEDYTQCLKSQTFANFEVVFVDQGSTDGTVDQLPALWKDDGRLRFFESTGGRAESLNLALSKATHDVCVVAEADDVSLPRRLELTVRYFQASSLGCLSFASFTETDLFGGAISPTSIGLRARSLLGAPAFGTLSFRKTRFAVPFDASLAAGCESKWMRDNLSNGSEDGDFIPLHQVFRRSDEAITDAESHAIRESEVAMLYAAHEQLLGQMSEEDRWCCRVLGGLDGISAKDRISVIEGYVVRLITKNAEKRLYDQSELQDLLVTRKLSLEQQKLKRLHRKDRRELRRLRELCSNYERQLVELGGGPKEE